MKKSLAILLSVGMLLSLLAGCEPAETPVDPVDPSTPTDPSTPVTPSDPTTPAVEELTDWRTYLTLTNEMETFNILYSQSNKELRILTNCIDGLLTNDNKGNLVPNAAESWDSTDGGLTWTFKLRDGMTWVDYQGNVMADNVASDWMWGLEWVLNFWKNSAANTSMPIEMIEGAGDYYTYTKGLTDESDAAEIAAFEAVCEKYGLEATSPTEAEAKAFDLTIFSQMVGIEAPDDNTLIYHCIAPMPYFPTVATYSCLMPAAPALLEQLGTDGFIAVTYNTMWCNGPYTITTYTQGNEKVLTKNPNYWNKDLKTFNTVTVKMVESADVAYQLFNSGELDYISLTEANLQTISKATSHEFHDNLVEARPTKYSYQLHLVYDKKFSDGSADENWNQAVANEAFRLAWYYGLDATNYLSRLNAINPLKCSNFTYTMSNLCSLSDGTEYTQLVCEKLGIQKSLESYARYDADKAAQYKQQAMEELSAKGVTFPVTADYFISGASQTAMDSATVLKQVFSDCLGDDFVVLNINTYISSLSQEVRNPQLASFYINGWGADYGDPQNYLGQETYGMDNAYYSNSYSKINQATDADLIATYQEFTDMVNAANAIVDNTDARYEAYADAEVYMLEHALVIPWYIDIGWQITHVNDYSKNYALYGMQGERYVNWETSVEPYTTEQYAAFEAAYNAE